MRKMLNISKGRCTAIKFNNVRMQNVRKQGIFQKRILRGCRIFLGMGLFSGFFQTGSQ